MYISGCLMKIVDSKPEKLKSDLSGVLFGLGTAAYCVVL